MIEIFFGTLKTKLFRLSHLKISTSSNKRYTATLLLQQQTHQARATRAQSGRVLAEMGGMIGHSDSCPTSGSQFIPGAIQNHKALRHTARFT